MANLATDSPSEGIDEQREAGIQRLIADRQECNLTDEKAGMYAGAQWALAEASWSDLSVLEENFNSVAETDWPTGDDMLEYMADLLGYDVDALFPKYLFEHTSFTCAYLIGWMKGAISIRSEVEAQSRARA